ncbi:MAG: hypothetical protein U0517_02130 [Candidatus Andersenbacteria bacterium]
MARESLSEFFNRHIAAAEGVRPEEITSEYIQRRRREIYQDSRELLTPDPLTGQFRAMTRAERDQALREWELLSKNLQELRLS